MHWPAIATDLKPIYTAPSESAALEAFVAFTDTWGERCPAITKLRDAAWAEFVPSLQFDNSIRSVVCTTNAIERINARIRRAVNARGHFPTEAAALKCVYLEPKDGSCSAANPRKTFSVSLKRCCHTSCRTGSRTR